jgi:cytochrome c-type biogenesis protein CcmH
LALALISAPVVALSAQPDTEQWDPDSYPEPALPPPGEPPPANAVDQITLTVSQHLRCPVCQGSSVADSPSDSAVAMNGRIRELVAKGYTEPQIRDYFAERYGEWMLMSPDATGLNFVVWVGPGLFAGLGGVWLLWVVANWHRDPDEVPLPSDVGLAPKDKYEAALLQEIDR